MGIFSFFSKKEKRIDERLAEAVDGHEFSTEVAPQAKKTWKKLALILPGGGSRGALEVGGIKALWKHGIIPDVILGSSVGSINGAIMASGRSPEELEQIWHKMTGKLVFPTNYKIVWQMYRVRSVALTSNIKRILKYSVKGDYFEDCKIPFYAITTRLADGEPVWFSKGPIRDAVMASLSIPPYFPPQLIDNIKYVDGSISGVNGIKKAVELGCDKIIVLNASNTSKRFDFSGILDVTSHSLDLMFHKNMLREMDLCISPFSNTEVITVRVPYIDVQVNDFTKTYELIEKGERETLRVLKQKKIL